MYQSRIFATLTAGLLLTACTGEEDETRGSETDATTDVTVTETTGDPTTEDPTTETTEGPTTSDMTETTETTETTDTTDTTDTETTSDTDATDSDTTESDTDATDTDTTESDTDVEPVCGDGVVDDGEACDDGNDVDDDECSNECVAASCGDGIVNSDAEECDDGNAEDTDECLSTCLAASCGDGYIQADVEACDDMGESAECNSDCSAHACGDGILNESAGEECDDANEENSDECVGECTVAICGDGYVYEGVELCDGGSCSDTCDGFAAYCVDIYNNDMDAPNGMYTIDPDGPDGNDPYEVYCDMDKGGHTVYAVTHDWGEWGSDMTIVIRDRLVPELGAMSDWTATCELFDTTNYVGGWKNNGQTYSKPQFAVYADSESYWDNIGTAIFPDATYEDILILQDSNAFNCWAHYAEAGSLQSFGSPVGNGYSFCRNGQTANERYHIYLCL